MTGTAGRAAGRAYNSIAKDAGRALIAAMFKWVLGIVGLSLAGTFAWFQLNATKIAYVNGLEAYQHVPGREFILQHDAYVFVWKRNPTEGFALLGINHPAVATRVDALPPPATPPLAAGTELAAVRIVDWIPRGTRLEVTSVRREESRRAGTVITYEAKFLDERERPYQKVDLRPVLLPVARPGDPPDIDPTALAPWIKR